MLLRNMLLPLVARAEAPGGVGARPCSAVGRGAHVVRSGGPARTRGDLAEGDLFCCFVFLGTLSSCLQCHTHGTGCRVDEGGIGARWGAAWTRRAQFPPPPGPQPERVRGARAPLLERWVRDRPMDVPLRAVLIGRASGGVLSTKRGGWTRITAPAHKDRKEIEQKTRQKGGARTEGERARPSSRRTGCRIFGRPRPTVVTGGRF